MLLSAEERTLQMIANRANLPDVLDSLCRAVDAHSPTVISTILLMDPDGTRLWPGAGPHFPAELIPVVSPWTIGSARGSCGTAAFLKQRVVISDVTTDPRWPEECRDLAVRHGLRASWSEPLISANGTVLGTLAMYYPEPRTPDPGDLEIVVAAGHIALIAIQMAQSGIGLRQGDEPKLDQQALTNLSQRWLHAQEEERTRVAHELRNDINERLILIAAALDGLQHNLPSRAAELRRKLTELNQELVGATDDIHALSDRLHSWKLEILGLATAAASFCRKLSERQERNIAFQSRDIPQDLSHEISLGLYRVLQQALENALRYSRSPYFEVLLTGAPNKIELSVTDWGIGFELPAMQERGLGLTSMKEWLKLVGGELTIESQPQHGTKILARVPLVRNR
jgi:signal transduction histidine kinase